uniref:TSP1_CCN domain-containing protein n=1 Tax=Loa loa TaxID=7209 RepID=A0A1I7VSJ2_LOALO
MATLAEQLNPTPIQQAENEPSVVEEKIVASTVAGADTEELSDLSEGYEGSITSTKGSSSFSSWYHRIAPLVRNRQVRVLAHGQLLEHDMPCFYRFKPWSQCSATCWEDGQPMPFMKREIDESKLVMTRGKSFAKCPSNIKKNFIQKAPCNLQRCPLKLSSFSNWTECIYKNPELRKEGGCYQMRMLPLEDRLIYVDTSELTRDCSNDHCPQDNLQRRETQLSMSKLTLGDHHAVRRC